MKPTAINWSNQEARVKEAQPVLSALLETFQREHKLFSFELSVETRPPRFTINAYFLGHPSATEGFDLTGSKAREYSHAYAINAPDEKTMENFGAALGRFADQHNFVAIERSRAGNGKRIYRLWPRPSA